MEKFTRHTAEEYIRHIGKLNMALGIDASHTRSVLELCRAICADELLFAKFEYFRDRYLTGELEHREQLAECASLVGVTKYELALALCEMYSLDTLELYRRRGLDTEKVYTDSMRDIAIWAQVCLERFGVYGIADYGWLSYTLTGEIVRLGRLQFHTVPFGREPADVCGVSLTRESRVINVHIPSGESLTAEACTESYRQAYELFGLTGRAPFVCDSWLLYPAHREMLGQDSGIVRFAADYRTLSVTEYAAGESPELWRVFGYRETYSPDTLPSDSALRRAYIKRLRDSGRLGSAFGVMIFDGQGVVREEMQV